MCWCWTISLTAVNLTVSEWYETNYNWWPKTLLGLIQWYLVHLGHTIISTTVDDHQAWNQTLKIGWFLNEDN